MCDCEMPEFYNSSTPKARKEHKCCECRGTIQAGEVYNYFVGAWSGDFQIYKTCQDCDALRSKVLESMTDCNCIAFSELYQYVFEGKILDQMKEYRGIKLKRGAKLHEWMQEVIQDLESKSLELCNSQTKEDALKPKESVSHPQRSEGE